MFGTPVCKNDACQSQLRTYVCTECGTPTVLNHGPIWARCIEQHDQFRLERLLAAGRFGVNELWQPFPTDLRAGKPWTPLGYAIANRALGAVSILLFYGANVEDCFYGFGWSPLGYAIEWTNVAAPEVGIELVELLLQAGANPSGTFRCGGRYFTPWQLAHYRGIPRLTEMLPEPPEVIVVADTASEMAPLAMVKEVIISEGPRVNSGGTAPQEQVQQSQHAAASPPEDFNIHDTQRVWKVCHLCEPTINGCPRKATNADVLTRRWKRSTETNHYVEHCCGQCGTVLSIGSIPRDPGAVERLRCNNSNK